MRLWISLCIMAAGALGVALTAHAHHSIAATYDESKEVALDGKLAELLFRNPHSFLHVEAPDKSGKMQRWSLEWRSSGALGQQGITRTTLKVGDPVVITMSPSWTATDHRGVLKTLRRKTDNFGWGTRPGEVVD
jgi:hypothetical protein